MSSCKVTALILLILCFLFMGCATFLYPTPSDLQAQGHMKMAQALEASRKYEEAVKEYIIVAEQYPRTKYYQAAIRKAAWLNLQPDNPAADAKAALRWLKVYLTLPLSPEDRESEELRIALLEQIDRLTNELSRQVVEKNTLKTVKHKQSNKLASAKKRVKDLEAELAHARIQLEEMKEVDLRMHTRRVNGSNGNALNLEKDKTDLYPEGYSLDLAPKAEVSLEQEEVSPPDQEKPMPDKKGEILAAHFRKGDIDSKTAPVPTPVGVQKDSAPIDKTRDQKRRVYYPYTVQVSSFPNKAHSIFEAEASRESGRMGFTSQVNIPGKGAYYRVFIGVYQTLEEAKKNALDLNQRDYPDAFAVELPYAIRIEGHSIEKNQKHIENKLQSFGYITYSIPDRISDKKSILIGAFKTSEEPERISNALNEQGFKSTAVLR